MTTEERFPPYYDFLKGLLSLKRLDKEMVNNILKQYKIDPDGFENDINLMHECLTSTGLTDRDADYIALTFHVKMTGRPYLEIAEEERFYGCF